MSMVATAPGLDKGLSDQERLILHVALPRLAAHVDRLAHWLDGFHPGRIPAAGYELAMIPGAEGLAVLAHYSPQQRMDLLMEADVPDHVRPQLAHLIEHLGGCPRIPQYFQPPLWISSSRSFLTSTRTSARTGPPKSPPH